MGKTVGGHTRQVWLDQFTSLCLGGDSGQHTMERISQESMLT